MKIHSFTQKRTQRIVHDVLYKSLFVSLTKIFVVSVFIFVGLMSMFTFSFVSVFNLKNIKLGLKLPADASQQSP